MFGTERPPSVSGCSGIEFDTFSDVLNGSAVQFCPLFTANPFEMILLPQDLR
jgi:hypothetical protein